MRRLLQVKGGDRASAAALVILALASGRGAGLWHRQGAPAGAAGLPG